MTLPRAYLAALALVAAVFAFVALTGLGIIPVQSVFLLLLNYVFQVFAVTVLAGLGGVFVGMYLAHRMLAGRGFTPFERELLSALADVRTELQRMQARDAEQRERLEALEKRLR